MWYWIGLVWLLLCYPLAKNIDKEMVESSNPLRFNIIVNLLILVKTLILMPVYYVMVIKNILANRK